MEILIVLMLFLTAIGTIVAYFQVITLRRSALAFHLLRAVHERVMNASGVHYIPPKDGPSCAVRKYTSPSFDCTAGDPRNYPANEYSEPTTLAYAEGFIGGLDGKILSMVAGAFPMRKHSHVSQIRYSFSMSDEGERALRLQRGLQVELEIGDARTEKSIDIKMTLDAKQIAMSEVDTLFREIVCPEFSNM